MSVVMAAVPANVASQQSHIFPLVGLVYNSSYVNSQRCPVLVLKLISPALLAILKLTEKPIINSLPVQVSLSNQET